jgi:hypothetical protein
MMKATGMQTTTAIEGATSLAVDLATPLRGARCADAVLAAQIAALVEAEGRQRTEHAEERALLQARCDALEAERDRAVEATDRAEARICALRAHVEARIERDRAMLASSDAGHSGSDAMETTRPRRTRRVRTLLPGEGTAGGAGSAEPCAAGTAPVGSEPTSVEKVAVPTRKDMQGVAAEAAPEHGPERAPEDLERGRRFGHRSGPARALHRPRACRGGGVVSHDRRRAALTLRYRDAPVLPSPAARAAGRH